MPVSPQGKSFDVGDEYKSTGRNVSTNSQILGGNLFHIAEIRIISNIRKEKKPNKPLSKRR